MSQEVVSETIETQFVPDFSGIKPLVPERFKHLLDSSPLPDVLNGEIDQFSTEKGSMAVIPEDHDLLDSIDVLLPNSTIYRRATNSCAKVLHMMAAIGDSQAQERLFIDYSGVFAEVTRYHFGKHPDVDTDLIRQAIYRGFTTSICNSKIEKLSGMKYRAIQAFMYKAVNWSIMNLAESMKVHEPEIASWGFDSSTHNLSVEDLYLQKQLHTDVLTISEDALDIIANPSIRRVVQEKLFFPETTFAQMARKSGVDVRTVRIKYSQVLSMIHYYIDDSNN